MGGGTSQGSFPPFLQDLDPRELQQQAQQQQLQLQQQAPTQPFEHIGMHGAQALHAPVQVPPIVGQTDRLFVMRLPQSVTTDELRAHFSRFGDVTDVFLPQVPGSSQHKGIAFLSFTNPESLARALHHPAHELHGQAVTVDVAIPRSGPGGGMLSAALVQPAVPSTALGSTSTQVGPQKSVAAPSSSPSASLSNAAVPGVPGGGVPAGGRLFVTKVAPDVSVMDLRTYFGQFGQLADVYVPPGNKGIAFASYFDPASAQAVLKSSSHEVRPGRVVVVDQAFERPPMGSKGPGKGSSGKPRFGPY